MENGHINTWISVIVIHLFNVIDILCPNSYYLRSGNPINLYGPGLSDDDSSAVPAISASCARIA